MFYWFLMKDDLNFLLLFNKIRLLFGGYYSIGIYIATFALFK